MRWRENTPRTGRSCRVDHLAAVFTGLVEATARLRGVERREWGARLLLEAPAFSPEMREGDSLALNGCCLTLARRSEEGLGFDLLQETLDRTNLGRLEPGARINLERALRADARLGGHFVQGHVDATARVVETRWRGEDFYVEVSTPPGGKVYLVEKGSVALNGVSLTVAVLEPEIFGVWLIPHTQAVTNLGELHAGAEVNLEYDLLAKHTVRFLTLQRGSALEG